MTLSTPAGSPASSADLASSSSVSGVFSSHLRTKVLPAASAGPSFQPARTRGKLNGTMPAHTPMGSRRRTDRESAVSGDIGFEASGSKPRAREAKTRRFAMPSPMWKAPAVRTVTPFSVVASCASRSDLASMLSAIRSSTSARCSGVFALQVPSSWAALAAATAASACSTPPKATRAPTSPVAGETMS